MTDGADSLRHRDAVLDTDLRRALSRLAWPAVVATGAQATFAIADAIYVGRWLGTASLAAVSTAAFVLWSLGALTGSVSIGVSALLARRVGEGEAAKAETVVRQGVLLAVVGSVLIAFIGWPLAPGFFQLMGVDPEVAGQGATYLRVLFAGSVSLFAFQVAEAVFRGVGDTKTPLKLLLASVAANLFLDPVLILGLGPFPELGVAGAALASVVARGGVALVAVVLLVRRGLLKTPDLEAWRPHLKTWRALLRIGVPASANGVFFCAVYMILARITADFGTPVIAALGVGHKGEAPCYFVALGISLAVAPLVGQSLGAGRPDRAEAAAWLAVRVACAWGVVWTVVLFTLPRFLSAAFLDDPEVIRVSSRYLVIMGFSQILMCVEVVLDGAFAGAGDTLPPLLIGLPLTAARIPLAWYLAHSAGLGADGIWIAITVSTMAKGLLLALWFRRGRWKLREVG